MDEEQLQQMYETVKRELETRDQSNDLHKFLLAAWNVIRPSEQFKDGWHIRALCKHLEAVSDGRLFASQISDTLLINIPPGHMKSLLCCVVWPAWHWATRPSAKFLFASYSGKFAIRDSIARRFLIQSRWYQDRWPLPLSDDENATTKFSNVRGGSMAATSPGGIGTGEHPHFIVVDDPLSAKDADSLASREAVVRWWSSTVASRGVIHESRKVVIAQRLHREDLPGHILSNESPIHICLPLEFEGSHRMPETPIGWRDERETLGEVLWPEAFDAKRVAKLKRMAPRDQAAQLQQTPPDQSSDSEFPASYFSDSIWFEDWPSDDQLFCKVAYLDPSLGKTEKSDLSAFTLITQTLDGRIWVDANIERRDVSAICDETIRIFQHFRPEAIGIEGNGFQMLLQPLLESKSKAVGVTLPLWMVNHSASKLARVRLLSWRLRDGHIRIRDTVGGRMLVEQLREFPGHQYDDGPDSLAGGLELMDRIWGIRLGEGADEEIIEERV